MKNMYFKLGASLYTPANHKNLTRSLNFGIAGERSMVVCTEDAVSIKDLEDSLESLRNSLVEFKANGQYKGKRFIRPRNPKVFKEIIEMEGVEKIDGFVLPKATVSSLSEYIKILEEFKQKNLKEGKEHKVFMIMPTLETPEAMSIKGLQDIRIKLEEIKEQIVCLRIGGNDLMGILGIKRMPGLTIYETPIRAVIDMIITEFRPFGYEVSAPVFDYIDDRTTLYREMEQDLNYGFFAKTAIHPQQIPVIDSAYREYLECNALKATQLVKEDTAIYQDDGQMMEKTCHFNWAVRTKEFFESAKTFYGDSMEIKEDYD